jgi:DNA helicase-2/ATP-dependent DNA helicase PcrA
MSDNQPTVEWGDTIHHARFGTGRVLTVEGTGHRTQALIDFNCSYIWVVLKGAPLTIVHKRTAEEP